MKIIISNLVFVTMQGSRRFHGCSLIFQNYVNVSNFYFCEYCNRALAVEQRYLYPEFTFNEDYTVIETLSPKYKILI